MPPTPTEPAPEKTRYPISRVCPACGSAECKKVTPEIQTAFAYDRICTRCNTRYTPPLPAWGLVVLLVLAAALVVLAPVLIILGLVSIVQDFMGKQLLVPPAKAISMGLLCLPVAAWLARTAWGLWKANKPD